MKRIASIDIFRAITMLLMVFVDDLWTLHGVPHWLEHTSVGEDGMGLSDVVFPAFLFIVGLSIPFAIKARINKGETKSLILIHILIRSFALIVMGFFLVNLEYYQQDAAYFTRKIWIIAMVIAFIMIWNHYEKKSVTGKIIAGVLQVCGIFMLIVLAATYQAGSPENPQWMSPHWWGILGLIGWAYLLSSLIILIFGNRIWIIAIFWIIFNVLNTQEFHSIAGYKGFKIIISASNYSLVMSGILATLIYIKVKDSKRKFFFPIILLILASLSMAYGFAVRPYWGISKILATPSWTAISAGISFLFFAAIYVASDIFNHTRWAKWIMPAGRSTLTCYFLPVMAYPLLYPFIRQLPETYTVGMAGVSKSILFALAIIIMTGALEKMKVKMKL